MEEVRDEEVKKHVCKLCNKRYPSGKSLGGHMRSHVIASRKALNFATVVEEQEDDDDDDDGDDDDDDDGDGDGDDDHEANGNNEGKNSVYGLRENPKKTWRLVDNISGKNNQLLHTFHMQQQERVCKQCGKGFNSLKALCGHMSSHSDKEKNFKEQDDDNSWSSDCKEHLFLAVESHSDNKNNNNSISISKRQTRSSLSRYRSLTAVDSVSPTDVCGGGGFSSNQSEIDQHDQEEVAMCLMMLSRDSSGYKTCFNFAAESSDNDNNSVILEGGSSSNYIGIGATRKDLHLINNKKKIKQVIVVAKKEVNVMNNKTQEINNSDSGYFENGAKALESDDSVDGFVRYYGFNKSKVEIGSRIIGDSCYDVDDSKKRKIRDVVNFNFDSPESDENCSKKNIMKQDYYCYNSGNNNNDNSVKKGSKYECWKCNRTFKTHQALGGHIISHRKTGDNSLETNNSAKQLNNNPKNLAVATTTTTTTNKIMASSKAKKVKGHKCPYCPRVFKSGQALGGHKRSHMMGGGSGGIVNLHLEAEKLRIERKRAPPPPRPPQLQPQPEPQLQHQQPALIDLNLPAPMEEEGGGNSQFVGW